MTTRFVPPHYIRPNEGVRIPSRHVMFDTEARSVFEPRTELQSWRCGAAVFAHRSNRGHWHRDQTAYEDPAMLWADVAEFTRPGKRTVLWAHNLAYDLRTSAALVELPRLGFRLADIRLSGQGTWARFADSERALVMVDSLSVWPCSLEKLGAMIGLGKPPLPTGDDMAEWFARCSADVEILAEAVTRYLDWLRAEQIGSWQMTGAGQAWSNWRHKHYTHPILVLPDERTRDAERRAIWTGRAEAWRWGHDPGATVFDYDYRNAYPVIAADCEVPVKPYSVARRLRLDQVLRLADRYAVLAEVSVSTDRPLVPAALENRICWPVGEFETVLWDPEIRLLAEHGARLQLGRIWLYRKAPALQEWARWVLGQLGADDDVCPAWRKEVVKHWSRALIGRFAMRYTAWEPLATARTPGLSVSDGWDVDHDEPFTLLQVGTDVFAAAGEVDSDNAAPMVTGYITSLARVKLWRAMELIGFDHVLYVDTDAVLVDTEGDAIIRANAGHPALAGLRLKRKFRGYDIAGPRQLVLGGEPRIAGVPRRARQLARHKFSGEVWRGLGESIRHGEATTVRITTREFTIKAVDRRRVRLAGGYTEAIRLPATGAGSDAVNTRAG